MRNTETLTGIPIEALFGVIGALGMIVYASMMWEIRRLRSMSELRHDMLVRVQTAMRLICKKLDIDPSILDDK